MACIVILLFEWYWIGPTTQLLILITGYSLCRQRTHAFQPLCKMVCRLYVPRDFWNILQNYSIEVKQLNPFLKRRILYKALEWPFLLWLTWWSHWLSFFKILSSSQIHRVQLLLQKSYSSDYLKLIYLLRWPLLILSWDFNHISQNTNVVCVSFISQWWGVQFEIDSKNL